MSQMVSVQRAESMCQNCKSRKLSAVGSRPFQPGFEGSHIVFEPSQVIKESWISFNCRIANPRCFSGSRKRCSLCQVGHSTLATEKADKIQRKTELDVSVCRKDQVYVVLLEIYQKFVIYNRFYGPTSVETACKFCRISVTSL